MRYCKRMPVGTGPRTGHGRTCSAVELCRRRTPWMGIGAGDALLMFRKLGRTRSGSRAELMCGPMILRCSLNTLGVQLSRSMNLRVLIMLTTGMRLGEGRRASVGALRLKYRRFEVGCRIQQTRPPNWRHRRAETKRHRRRDGRSACMILLNSLWNGMGRPTRGPAFTGAWRCD